MNHEAALAKAKEIGVGGGIDPDRRFQFGRDAGGLRRIEAGAGELENSAELEVIAHELCKEGGVRLGGVRAGSKVRYCQARFVRVAEASACAKPPFGLCKGSLCC